MWQRRRRQHLRWERAAKAQVLQALQTHLPTENVLRPDQEFPKNTKINECKKITSIVSFLQKRETGKAGALNRLLLNETSNVENRRDYKYAGKSIMRDISNDRIEDLNAIDFLDALSRRKKANSLEFKRMWHISRDEHALAESLKWQVDFEREYAGNIEQGIGMALDQMQSRFYESDSSAGDSDDQQNE